MDPTGRFQHVKLCAAIAAMVGLLIGAQSIAQTEERYSNPSADVIVVRNAAPSMGGVFGVPLVVGPADHAVVMEYEAWFGPHAISFHGAAEANPVLQSADMDVAGCSTHCGYDSEDAHVIRQHVTWLRQMGIDAITLDDTNDVACIYDSAEFAAKYLGGTGCNQSKSSWVQIGVNNANIYSAWNDLKTPLKVIPLLGAADPLNFTPDPYDQVGHKPALEKEIDYYARMIEKYPGMSVIYDGKPLLLLFVAVNADEVFPLIQTFLRNHPALTAKYTFRLIGGYFDSQPSFWAPSTEQKFWTNRGTDTPSGPTEIDPTYGFWSGGDRFNTTCETEACQSKAGPYATYPFYPTYNMNGARVESFAASIAVMGAYGWSLTTNNVYAPDAALRLDAEGSYVTLDRCMQVAEKLKPTFLIINQFNEFSRPDEGWDANTSNDMEPADLWGYSGIIAVQDSVVHYRDSVRDGG